MIKYMRKLGQSAIRPTLDPRPSLPGEVSGGRCFSPPIESPREFSSRCMADWLVKLPLILLIVLLPLASSRAAKDDGIYTYVFHLYFDNGKLTADRDFSIPFELIAEKYNGLKKTDNSFYGEILSVSNKKLADFPLDLPYGGKGKISPKAPYFDNVKTANFYNRENMRIFSLDLAPAGPVCNENGQCDSETGETYQNCAVDCPAPTPSASPLLPITRRSFRLSEVFTSPVFIGLGLTLALVLILVLLKILRRKKNNTLPPPQL